MFHITNSPRLCLQTFQVGVEFLLALDDFVPGDYTAFVGGGPAKNRDEVAADARLDGWVVELAARDVVVERRDVGDGAFLIDCRACAAAVEMFRRE